MSKRIKLFEDFKLDTVNESQAYKCKGCGERLEHEEYQEDPHKVCSNCGGSEWEPENECMENALSDAAERSVHSNEPEPFAKRETSVDKVAGALYDVLLELPEGDLEDLQKELDNYKKTETKHLPDADKNSVLQNATANVNTMKLASKLIDAIEQAINKKTINPGI
jgi:hypothetical protein